MSSPWIVSGTLRSTLYLCDERRSRNPTAGVKKLRGRARLQIGDQADVDDLVGEVLLEPRRYRMYRS